jgi:cytochrome c biogenesis protein CcmG/thiol:disulfide interchange protein DsbE
VPETFLINRKGLVIFRHAGPITEDVLKKLLIPKLKEIGL